MPKDAKAKLEDTEIAIRRWHTRLARATNTLLKLEKRKRRLQLTVLSADQPVIATVKVRKQIEAKADLVQAIDDQLTNIIEGKPADIAELDDLAVPAFLNRSDPLIAEKMTAARKAAEAAARKAMPLTGREALDYIKRKKK